MTGRAKLVVVLLGVLTACSKKEGAVSSDSTVSTGMRASAPATASSTEANVANKDGWWIKIQKTKQESPTIAFSIGSNNHTVEAWKTWSSNEPLEFDVPDKFKNINPLYIKAQSSGGRNSWFCMMYKDHGVKHFDFDDDEDHEEHQSDSDSDCNFSN